MFSNRRLGLKCLMLASVVAGVVAGVAAGCGGRSGLDDFSNGAPDSIVGTSSGSNDGAGNAGDDADGGQSDGDGGDSSGNGGSGNGGSSGNGSGGNGGTSGGGSGDAPIGAACAKDSSCEGKAATCLTEVSIGGFFMLDFPKGYCAVEGCEDDSDCPKGSGCLNAFGMQICLQTCDRDRDCRSGDGCNTFAARVCSAGGNNTGP